MSARHRQHKRKIRDAEEELADCHAALLAYERVITDMIGRAADLHVQVVRDWRNRMLQRCLMLRGVIEDLRRSMPAPRLKEKTDG